jgi:hypothetical protein
MIFLIATGVASLLMMGFAVLYRRVKHRWKGGTCTELDKETGLMLVIPLSQGRKNSITPVDRIMVTVE